MATSISTVRARDVLKARHEPYFVKLAKGQYLGFQKLTPTSTGGWIARYRDADGKQQKKGLGDFAHLPASDRFDAAKKAAEAHFVHLAGGGTNVLVTVRSACEIYVSNVRSKKGDLAADDIAKRFERWVYTSNSLASVALPRLTRKHVAQWRKELEATPAQVNRDSREQPVTRPRAASSVNRDMTALRAALNHAHEEGFVTTNLAWIVELKPTKRADGRRELYLDPDQRRALVANAGAPDIAAFLRGMCTVPLRPGALSALTVASFDARLSVLSIAKGSDKAGDGRRIKLPPVTAAFFADQSKGKTRAAFLFPRADGKQFGKDVWKGPVKAAAAAAQLPPDTTAYTLRHSVITDLVTQGLDLLTVAQLSGTSVEMIERHYGHLRADHAAAALATLTA